MPAAVITRRKLTAVAKLSTLAGALWAAPVVVIHAVAFAFWNPPDRVMLEIGAFFVVTCFVLCTGMTAVLLQLTAMFPSLVRGSRFAFSLGWFALALAMSAAISWRLRNEHDSVRQHFMQWLPLIAIFTVGAAIQATLIHRHAARQPHHPTPTTENSN